MRNFLYQLARLLGDINAVAMGPNAMARRISRRVAGKVAGRILGRLFK